MTAIHRRLSTAGLLMSLICAQALAAADQQKTENYPDGQKKLVYSVDDQGRKEGRYEEYFPNGKRKLETAYRDDKLHGRYRESFENGRSKLRANYVDGELQGEYVEYSEAGPIVKKENYRGGQLHGARQVYEDRDLVADEYWLAGKLLIPKSQAQIAAALRTIEKMNVETVGEVPADTPEVVLNALKDPGVQRAREDALRTLVAYRYVCHLPVSNLAIDRGYAAHTEAATQILEKIGSLTHDPTNPGWPEDVFQFARLGCQRSNLHSTGDAVRAVHGFMDDSDDSNIDRLGHRRWCLNPKMQNTAITGNHGYTAMWAMDGSREEVPDYTMVAFPPQGIIPAKFFKPDYAWSVSLNPSKYQKPEATTVKVALRPARLNAGAGTIETAAPLALNYSNVNLGGYGGNGNCIIFRPGQVRIAAGATYVVEITGLKDQAGQATTLEYFVGFF